MKTRAFKPLRAQPDQLLAITRDSSLPKSVYGAAAWPATGRKLPAQLDSRADILRAFDMICQEDQRLHLPEFNPLQAFPNEEDPHPGKLKFLVVMDPLKPKPRGSGKPGTRTRRTREGRHEVFCCRPRSRRRGSLTNSSRWLQWHWKAADPPGAQRRIATMSGCSDGCGTICPGSAARSPVDPRSLGYTGDRAGTDRIAGAVNGRR
jgi:formate dehydrogenase major subunit